MAKDKKIPMAVPLMTKPKEPEKEYSENDLRFHNNLAKIDVLIEVSSRHGNDELVAEELGTALSFVWEEILRRLGISI